MNSNNRSTMEPEQSVQARSATLHFPNVLACFAAPNLVRSTSSKQIRAHPARRAFYLIGRIFL